MDRIYEFRLGSFLGSLSWVIVVFAIFKSTSGQAQSFPLYDLVPLPENSQVEVNDNFTVVLQLQPQEGALIAGAQIRMSFNPDVVQVTNLMISPDSELNVLIFPPAFNNTTGELQLAVFSFAPASSSFDFVEIEFLAIANGTTTVDHIYTGSAATILAYGGESITGSTNSFTIQVGNLISEDCNGDADGVAYIDDCGNCVGGNTGEFPCNPSIQGSLSWNISCGSRNATIQFYTPGTNNLIDTYNTTIAPDGTFEIADILEGNFDLYINADGHLPKGIFNVAVLPGNNLLSVGSLIPGDVDNAGGINIDDLTGLLNSFGSSAGDSNFLLFADLNCDGAVNIDDLTALLSNFGATGDAPGLIFSF